MTVQRGFTLLELLIVLLLAGLGGAIAVASMDRFALRSESVRWFDETQRALFKLRNAAILGERVVRARIDYTEGAIYRDLGSGRGALVLRLPPRYAFLPGERTREVPAAHSFSFLPDGSATDAHFVLRDPDGRERHYRITGIAGRIEARDGVPR